MQTSWLPRKPSASPLRETAQELEPGRSRVYLDGVLHYYFIICD